MNIFVSTPQISQQLKLLVNGLTDSGNKVYCHINPSIGRKRLFDRKKMKSDIFHFHYGKTYSGLESDFRYVREKKRIRLMHYWGHEVRSRDLAVRHNPYIGLLEQFQEEKTIEKLLKAGKFIPSCIVPDREMVSYVSGSFRRIYVLPLAVDHKKIKPVYRKKRSTPVILHVPDRIQSSETAFIEENLKKCSDNGLNFEYVKAVNKTPEEIGSLIRRSDIVIDQIMRGFYGSIAVEAMCRGKAVISYIREDLRYSLNPQPPVVSANPATLYDKLSLLLKDVQLRQRCGEQGRSYIEKYHTLQLVMKQLQWIYGNEKRLLKRNRKDKNKYVYHCKGRKIEIYKVDPKTGIVSIRMKKSVEL